MELGKGVEKEVKDGWMVLLFGGQAVDELDKLVGARDKVKVGAPGGEVADRLGLGEDVEGAAAGEEELGIVEKFQVAALAG